MDELSLFAVTASNLLAARVMMAGTLAFHIVLAVLGVGMPVLLLAAEWRYLRTRDPLWKTLARRWSKQFAVLFAVGAVSGTVLSFELGLLWPGFMAAFGSVIGLPFTLEGFAFFLEGIFVGIYLYGWDRLPERVHWLAGWPIALAGGASAWFVVTANSFMNCPQGFTLDERGMVVQADPVAAMLNPATPAQTAHMIVAAYLVTGFLIAGIYAVLLLRDRENVYRQRAFGLALTLAVASALPQVVTGHWAARMVAATQPIKLAALEGQFETEAGAPLRIGGLPNVQTRRTPGAIEIPGGLSWLAYGDRHAVVKGLNDFPPEDLPPVPIPHVAFQVMVAIGMGLALLSLYAAWHVARHRQVPVARGFLKLIALAGPLSVLALEAGWVVTEVGRQPWLVQGYLRTADAATDAPAVAYVLAVAAMIYLVLATGTIVVLRLLARVPLPEEPRGA